VSILQVSTPNTPVLSANANNFCPGDSIHLTTTPASSLLTYMWFKNGQPVNGPYGAGVTGISGSSYRVGEAGNYTVQTMNSNQCLSTQSNIVSVSVLSNVQPVISQQPVNNTINIGDTAVFSVIASNFDTIIWQFQPTNSTVWINAVSGPTSPYLNPNTTQLRVIASSPSLNGYRYRAIISGVSRCVQDITSTTAGLTVNQPLTTTLTIGNFNRCQTSANDTILVDVRSNRFNQVALAQFAIQKPSSFTFLGIVDRNPSLFALNTQTQGNNITISGFGSTAVTLPSNSLLFKLRLMVPAGSNGNETIEWNNSQTLVSDALQGVWSTTLVNGSVNTVPAPVSLTSATICQGQSFTFGNQTLISAGTYSRTISSSNGCDSVVTLTLNVLPSSATSLTASICQGQSYHFGAQLLISSGTYTRSLTAANGCDSLVTLTLSIRESTTASLSASICQGQTFAFGNQNLAASGVYSRTLTASNGCDSLITLTLTVNIGGSSTINASICQGQSYSFGSQNLVASGTYQTTLTAANGCDSIVTLNLLVTGLPARPTLTSSSISACQGDSIMLIAVPNSSFLRYRWFLNGIPVSGVAGQGILGGSAGGSRLVVSTGGTYTVTVENNSGCSSQASLGRALSFNALPAITQQPIAATVSLGASASFSASTSGATLFAWEYRINPNGAWIAINSGQGIYAGFTTSNLTVNALSNAFNGYQFRVKAKNSSCTNEVISNSATLTVIPGDPINLTIGNTNVCSNQNSTLHIPIISGSLSNLALIDASIALGNNLSFVGVDSIHPSISNLSVVQNGQSVNFSWFGINRINLPSNSRLFRLNLQASASDSIRWVNAGFYDEYQGTYTINQVNGAVVVNTGSTIAFQIAQSSVCQGSTNSIALSASPAGGTFSGTGVSGNSFNPTGLSVGFYNITYTYTNPGTGCVSIANTSIEIAAPPTGTVIANQSICQGQNASLQATGGQSYLWTNGQGITLGTGAVLSVSPNSTTDYFVRISNVNGCSVDLTTRVTVNQISPVTISNGDTIRLCIGSSATLHASGGYSSYQWFPVYAISNNSVSNPVITPRRNETYTVFATNANGCVTSKQVVVIVTPLPAVDAGNDAIYCGGSALNLQANGAGNNGTYSWSNGSNNAITSVSPSVTTTYYVTGTNSNGCSNTDSVKVYVPRVYAGNNRTVCAGDAVNLLATMLDYPANFPNPEITWYRINNGVPDSIGNSLALSASINITSEIVITVGLNNGNCFVSDTLLVTVASTPVVTIGGNSSISTAPSSTVPLSASITGASNSRTISWSILGSTSQGPGSLSSTTSLNPVYTAPAVSTQSTIQLIVRVTNPNGCGSSDTISISIDPALQGKTFSGTLRYDNNAGTPINDARIKLINTQNQVFTAEVNSQGVYFFPNLANGTYSVSIDTIRKTSGGVTSADVTMINNYRLNRATSPLAIGTPSANLRLRAADVSTSNGTSNTAGADSITIQDAQAAQRRAGNLSTNNFSFELATPQRIWAVPANSSTVTINGSDVSFDLNAVSYGDVNGSFSPVLRLNTILQAENAGYVAVAPGFLMNYPIRTGQAMDLAAWQMTFQVRDGYRVKGAQMIGDASSVLVNQIGNQVTMLWFAENGVPVQVKKDDNIVHLTLAKEDAGAWKDPIVDASMTDVEFNDGFAITYLQPRICLPIVTQQRDVQVNLYPNPVNEQQSLHLNVNTIHSGIFSYQIHDVSGRIVTTVTKNIGPGLQSIDMEIPGLAAGTYQMFWTLEGDRLNKSGTHKLTVVK
jgi:hypothetical protein